MGDPLNLDNFRRREWAVAVKASGVVAPARIYDMRATFASNALAAGVTSALVYLVGGRIVFVQPLLQIVLRIVS